jgi:hypothetical protein
VRRARLAVAVALLGLAASQADAGSLYQYVDESGTMHFTNVPTDGRYVRVRGERERPLRPPRIRSYDDLIAEAARSHGVPPALVKAVVATESWFNPRAVSPKGAQGLMQLMPATADSLGVSDPFQVAENLEGGVRYLRHLLDRYGDWTRALAAYNAGPEAVDRYGGIPPYRETRQYVERVLTYYRRYHGDFAP